MCPTYKLIAAAVIATAVLNPPAARAQEFEVISLKPSDPNSPQGTVVNFTEGGGIRALNGTLKDLIETAYDVRTFQVLGGPSWSDAARYDVTATPGPDHSDVRVKVQAMLRERFHLQLHRETKSLPIYSLAVAKGGVKSQGLRATGNPKRGVNAGGGTMVGEAASMADLAAKFSRMLHSVVVNNTGLEGNYDFNLQWTPDPGPPADPIGSLFSALPDQLGLRLEPTKGPVDVLAIDSATKPAEN